MLRTEAQAFIGKIDTILNNRALMTLLINNSSVNHHAPGLDYACLERYASGDYTLKLYDLRGTAKRTWLVNPHNHRYNFRTHVISGQVSNSMFNEVSSSSSRCYRSYLYNPFKDEGERFKKGREINLRRSAVRSSTSLPGQSYDMDHKEIHTILDNAADSMIVIQQYEDCIPDDQPTMTYVPILKKEKIDLSGLYGKMSEERYVEILKQAKINMERIFR